MKLKKSEIQTLINTIGGQAENIRFNTKLEMKLSGKVIRNLMKKLFVRLCTEKNEFNVQFTDEEILVLDLILPQLSTPGDVYANAVIGSLYLTINQRAINL